MKNWMKIGAALLAGVALFVAGYRYAAALYGEEIADLKEAYATRASALTAEYRKKEKENAENLVKAWEARDRALVAFNDLSLDAERVRRDAEELRRRLSRAHPDPCQPCREQLAGCAGLLERGAGVVERCVGVAQRAAVDKDAVVQISQ